MAVKPNEGQEEVSLRDTLNTAVTDLEEQEGEVIEGEGTVVKDGADEAEGEGKPAAKAKEPDGSEDEEGKPADKSKTEGEKVEDKAGIKRDAKGRIIGKKEGDKPDAEDGAPLGKGRAPSAWRPALREKWTALPADVQQEILKREREIGQGFNEISEVKKFRDTFLQTINPFQHVFQAEGGQPLVSIRNMLGAANTFYTGTAQQKAATAAAIIKNFDINIELLDSILAGQVEKGGGGGQGGGNGGGQDVTAIVQAAVKQALLPYQQQGEQQTNARAEQLITDFASDPKNEFYEDVKDTMADLLELAAKQGKTLDLPTAYSRAILAHSDIADIVASRKVSSQASAATERAKAAKKKVVSLTGAPSKESSTLDTDDSLRGDLERAMESQT